MLNNLVLLNAGIYPLFFAAMTAGTALLHIFRVSLDTEEL